MPHAYTLHTHARSAGRTLAATTATAFDVYHTRFGTLPKWWNNNRTERKEKKRVFDRTAYIRGSVWIRERTVFLLFVIVVFRLLPRRVWYRMCLCVCVRLHHTNTRAVFVVFMTLICEQQLHLLLTHSPYQCTQAHRYMSEKKVHTKHEHTHKNTTNVIYMVLCNAVKSRHRQNVCCSNCLILLAHSSFLLFVHSPLLSVYSSVIYFILFWLQYVCHFFWKKKERLIWYTVLYNVHVVIFNAWPVPIYNSALSQALWTNLNNKPHVCFYDCVGVDVVSQKKNKFFCIFKLVRNQFVNGTSESNTKE